MRSQAAGLQSMISTLDSLARVLGHPIPVERQNCHRFLIIGLFVVLEILFHQRDKYPCLCNEKSMMYRCPNSPVLSAGCDCWKPEILCKIARTCDYWSHTLDLNSQFTINAANYLTSFTKHIVSLAEHRKQVQNSHPKRINKD